MSPLVDQTDARKVFRLEVQVLWPLQCFRLSSRPQGRVFPSSTRSTTGQQQVLSSCRPERSRPWTLCLVLGVYGSSENRLAASSLILAFAISRTRRPLSVASYFREIPESAATCRPPFANQADSRGASSQPRPPGTRWVAEPRDIGCAAARSLRRTVLSAGHSSCNLPILPDR